MAFTCKSDKEDGDLYVWDDEANSGYGGFIMVAKRARDDDEDEEDRADKRRRESGGSSLAAAASSEEGAPSKGKGKVKGGRER